MVSNLFLEKNMGEIKTNQDELVKILISAAYGRNERFKDILEKMKPSHLNFVDRKLKLDVSFLSGDLFYSPLEYCSIFYFNYFLRLLLEKGADPNYNDTKALFLAASGGNFRCVKLLIEFGAEPYKRNEEGNTFLGCVPFKYRITHRVFPGRNVDEFLSLTFQNDIKPAKKEKYVDFND